MTTESNGYASREQLLGKAPRRHREVTLPVSGWKVKVQSLTEREHARFSRESVERDGQVSAKKLETIRRRLIVLCLVDSNGNPLLMDTDIESLAEWDSADVTALQSACEDHCGFNKNDLENLVKNSEQIRVAS